MKLKLKSLQGKETAFDVDDEATTIELKQKMSEQFNVSVDSLHVVYNGAQLKDELKLKDQGVSDGKPLFYFSKASKKPQTQPTAPQQQSQSPATTKQTTPSPAPVSSWGSQSTHATSSPSSTTPESTQHTTGVNEAALNELLSMGYDRSRSEAALKAAFGDVNVAVEYLMNGIPQDLVSLTQTAPSANTTPSSTPSADTNDEVDPAVFDSMTPEQLRAMAHRQDPIPVPGMHSTPVAEPTDAEASAVLHNTPPQLIALVNSLRRSPQYALFHQLALTNPTQCAAAVRQIIQRSMPDAAATVDVNQLVQIIRALQPMTASNTPHPTRLPADLFNGRLPEIAQRLGVTLPPAGTAPTAQGQTFSVFGDSGIRARSTGHGIEVAISMDDKAQIDHIKAVTGCNDQEALEAYIVCGKNTDDAINYVLDNK